MFTNEMENMDTRERILVAAMEMFFTMEYNKVTLKAIAEAAGVTKGGIYHYYESKDHLLQEGLKFSFTSIMSQMDGMLKQEMSAEEVGNAITQDLQNLDTQRDSCIIGIEQLIKGYTHHYNEATVELANLLIKSLDSYGNGISRQNYQSETKTIASIVKNWKSDSTYTNALNTLHLNSWLNKLEEINTEFEIRFLDRIKDDASQPEVKMTDYRKQTTESYRELTRHLEAHSTLTSETVYPELLKEINQLIEEYNRIIEKRSTKKEVETLEEE